MSESLFRRFSPYYFALVDLAMATNERYQLIYGRDAVSGWQKARRREDFPVQAIFKEIDYLCLSFVSLEYRTYLRKCIYQIFPSWIPTRFCPKFSLDALRQRRQLLSLMCYPEAGKRVDSDGWRMLNPDGGCASLPELLKYWSTHGDRVSSWSPYARVIWNANGKFTGGCYLAAPRMGNTSKRTIEAILLVNEHLTTISENYMSTYAVFQCELPPGVYRLGKLNPDETYLTVQQPSYALPDISIDDFKKVDHDPGEQSIIYYYGN